MTEWIPEKILTALIESGRTALSYYDAPEARLKSDRSIVTTADHAIEKDLIALLEEPDAGSYVIGEETVDTKSQSYIDEAFKKIAWIVDPIDGTAPYAHHIPMWGVSIARMENGVITDGGIYLPVIGEIFISDGSKILYSSKADATTMSDLSPIETSKTPPEPSKMIAVTQSVVKHGSFTLDNPAQALACAVVPLTYILLGRYMGYMGTLKLWDIAGCLALLDRAGFYCVMQNGLEVGCKVTNDVFRLEPDDPRRWFIRDRLYCGSTKEVVDYLLRGIS